MAKKAMKKAAPKKSVAKGISAPLSKKKVATEQTSQKPENEKETWLSIEKIETENPPEFRFRVQNDTETIERYAETLKYDAQGKEVEDDRHWPFPAIIVYRVGGKYIVLSGRHRLRAAILV